MHGLGQERLPAREAELPLLDLAQVRTERERERQVRTIRGDAARW